MRRPQRHRVIAALVEAGERGITQHDFALGKTAIDGGPPIARLASRIEELRNDVGYPILSAGWRNGLVVYRLADHGPRLALAPAPAARLFDPNAA